MDFVEGLPESHFKDVVLVVMERLTKYVQSISLAHPYIASKVAHLYVQHILKFHGMPSSILSDRDPIFTFHFWAELMKL